MTNSILETHIINLIEVNYGLKRTELVHKIMSLDLNISQNDILNRVYDMVESGIIIEIEMMFPNHTSRSFFVMRGTTFNVIRKVK
jgi:DNA-binding Lrp family transcriptional regulator